MNDLILFGLCLLAAVVFIGFMGRMVNKHTLDTQTVATEIAFKNTSEELQQILAKYEYLRDKNIHDWWTVQNLVEAKNRCIQSRNAIIRFCEQNNIPAKEQLSIRDYQWYISQQKAN